MTYAITGGDGWEKEVLETGEAWCYCNVVDEGVKVGGHRSRSYIVSCHRDGQHLLSER